MIQGEYQALTKRELTEETCRKFGYTVGEMNGQKVQVAPYRDASGQVVAQKIRFPNKDFTVLGDGKVLTKLLFGAQLWNGTGRRIVITEGEIDAMSVSQAQGNKWPVVSVPNGASGAKRTLAKNLEYLNGYEEVVLCFDMDEEGRKAVQECAPLFPPGKCRVASLPLKDANEMLKAGKAAELVQACWQAKPYRPDGVVKLSDLKERMKRPIERGLPWFLPTLTDLTYGRRFGEIYMLGAGTGVGKTDVLTQQIMHDITVLEEKVGVFFLEQEPEETGKRIAGKLAGKRFHVPDAGWSQEELDATVDRLVESDRLFLYDHFGSADWEIIANTIRFLAHSEGVRVFYVDHLTALADPSNERESLELLMAEVGGLVKELGIMVIMVSHLSTPEGKSHEEGGRVTIRHFKGSRAIGFWSHFMFGLERDQQHDDAALRKTTTFRVLKDRYTGTSTGQVFWLAYDTDTGLLRETEEPQPSGFKDETQAEDDLPF